MYFYKLIYNPTEYIFDLHPNITNYISYKNFMRKKEEFRNYNNNDTQLYTNVILNKTDAKVIFDNLPTLETMRNDKIIVYLNNLLILSIFMIICSVILFFLRKYRKDWKQDMVPFYMVNLDFIF